MLHNEKILTVGLFYWCCNIAKTAVHSVLFHLLKSFMNQDDYIDLCVT